MLIRCFDYATILFNRGNKYVTPSYSLSLLIFVNRLNLECVFLIKNNNLSSNNTFQASFTNSQKQMREIFLATSYFAIAGYSGGCPILNRNPKTCFSRTFSSSQCKDWRNTGEWKTIHFKKHTKDTPSWTLSRIQLV